MMPHVRARGQSIPATRRQLNDQKRIASTSSPHRRTVSPRVHAAVTRGLSDRTARLLLEGDTEGRYASNNDTEAGYRITMAIAAGASQPGREWTPADFIQALIYTPTPGGEWARELWRAKGVEYAERKLTAMLAKARAFVAEEPAVTCRQSAWERIQGVRALVDRMRWTGGGGGDTDLKNLTVRLGICELVGGLEHELSVRRQAEEMNCSKTTAQNSNRRLEERGLLRMVSSGKGKDRGSRWVLQLPEDVRAERGAQPGHSSAAEGRGGQGPVPDTHEDTRSLAKLIGHDAFHRWGHGANGARLLTQLEAGEGRSVKELADALGLHRTTVVRRLERLVDDGLVEKLEGLFYRVMDLGNEDGVQPEPALLQKAAERRETDGAQRRRKDFHRAERAWYRLFRDAVRRKVNTWIEERRRLVPADVVDMRTGEILDPAWRGWDVSDPYRPVPRPAWAA
ncbi:MarR family transcriptional regulator [Streptomyces lavendulocolor]|uniref:MarR family transcriptional regulator n=1 Tax=Streptomyces lavendulocolor TaxID=67316 RepID=UPI003C2B6E4F